MKTKAVRLYGVNDLRLEEFELPRVKKDEILASVIADTTCMSTYKAVTKGAEHERVPDDIAVNPTIIGHEFSGEIIYTGEKWRHKFLPGMKYTIQPAINYHGSLDAPGYSFRYIGGAATYIIIPNIVMEMDCLMEYSGGGFFPASLAEPFSCVIGAFRSNYHNNHSQHTHEMGIAEGGNTAILGGCGPMGMAAINYLFYCDRKPGFLLVTDINEERLENASGIFTVNEAKKRGINIKYVNTAGFTDTVDKLLSYTGKRGYDDIFIFAPEKELISTADKLLAKDGCLNFFAGPVARDFLSEVNFYNIHYTTTHIIGSVGGNPDDIREALRLISEGMNPASMVSHIGGIDAVIDTTLNLPDIPGVKKLIYTHINMELTAIQEFKEKGMKDPLFRELHRICRKYNGLWSVEAENCLLNYKNVI